MSKPSSVRLSCVNLWDRARGILAGAPRRLVLVVVVLLAAAITVALGVPVERVVAVLAVPPGAVKLLDLAVSLLSGRRRPRTAAPTVG
ncbi:hypothetical protein ABZW30_12655 [Kitasatospora sp. NPDC004669]|uniref:hypothetical protein n=1 Tax=Kitasatospora sp. NPDC004669 TaxID=3154555 RepID=UPI0033B8DDC3